LWTDGRTDGRTDRHTDIWDPLMLLGQLGGVDLKGHKPVSSVVIKPDKLQVRNATEQSATLHQVRSDTTVERKTMNEIQCRDDLLHARSQNRILTLLGLMWYQANWAKPRFLVSLPHRRRSLWGTEAGASSEFRARRHAMERASPEFLPSNAARHLRWPKVLY